MNIFQKIGSDVKEFCDSLTNQQGHQLRALERDRLELPENYRLAYDKFLQLAESAEIGRWQVSRTSGAMSNCATVCVCTDGGKQYELAESFTPNEIGSPVFAIGAVIRAEPNAFGIVMPFSETLTRHLMCTVLKRHNQ